MDRQSRKERYQSIESSLQLDIIKVKALLSDPTLSSTEETFLKSTLSNLNAAASRMNILGDPSKQLMRYAF